MGILLEELTHSNFQNAQEIQREDIPESWVDSVETLIQREDIPKSWVEHKCIGHSFLAKNNGKCIGIIILGEAIPWVTDPIEMKNEPYYRLFGFVIDKSYRSKNFGGEILEMAINEVYQDFGKRPIALGCHKENTRAAMFYEKHGFKRTGVFEGNDEYFLRLI